jgi:hypothetical protein
VEGRRRVLSSLGADYGGGLVNPERLMTLDGTLISRAPGPPDAFGGDVLVSTSTPVKCWFSSPQTEERLGQVFQVLTLYVPPYTPVDNITAVDLPGMGTFEVDGSPMSHVSPRTMTPTHTTIRIRRGA